MEFKVVDGYPYLDNVKNLIIEYNKFLNRDLSFQGMEDELKHLDKKYGSGEGRLFVAINDTNDVCGCIAYHKLNDERCEMKRLFIKPDYRGHKLGDLLIDTLINKAKQDGYKEMVLDTIEPLKAAIHLYEKHGFNRCKAYYYNPMSDVIYMKRNLE